MKKVFEIFGWGIAFVIFLLLFGLVVLGAKYIWWEVFGL